MQGGEGQGGYGKSLQYFYLFLWMASLSIPPIIMSNSHANVNSQNAWKMAVCEIQRITAQLTCHLQSRLVSLPCSGKKYLKRQKLWEFLAFLKTLIINHHNCTILIWPTCNFCGACQPLRDIFTLGLVVPPQKSQVQEYVFGFGALLSNLHIDKTSLF